MTCLDKVKKNVFNVTFLYCISKELCAVIQMMSGNLKIWTIVFNPPLEKDALVRFYIMNGPTTKFRTKTIKRQSSQTTTIYK